MLLIVNYANEVMGIPPMMPPIMSDAPVMPPHHATSASTMVGAMLEFEKLQIMLLGFRYLESSEKSKKKYTNTTHIGL